MATNAARRLCAVFAAARTRYCVEAVSVAEVARVEPGDDTVRGHLPLKDLSALLGGGAEARPGEAVVLDTSPTLALRVGRVEGVVDVSAHAPLPLPRRLVPVLSPAVRSGIELDGRLVFEIDPESVGRGLPRQSKRPELVALAPTGPALVFETGEKRLGVPLERVRQVVAAGPGFNPAPSTGAFLGVLLHERALVPVWSLSGDVAEAFFVIVEPQKGDLVALSARRADGVLPLERLEGLTVVDLPRTFS